MFGILVVMANVDGALLVNMGAPSILEANVRIFNAMNWTGSGMAVRFLRKLVDDLLAWTEQQAMMHLWASEIESNIILVGCCFKGDQGDVSGLEHSEPIFRPTLQKNEKKRNPQFQIC